MVRVRIFMEGGGEKGDEKRHDIELRQAIHKLLAKTGLPRGAFQAVPCGSRHAAYKDFANALARRREGEDIPLLLVDSEQPVSEGPWQHLTKQDGWERPVGAQDEHAHLMVPCMESWFLADREALAAWFGKGFHPASLPATRCVEDVDKSSIFNALNHAAKNTGKGGYRKGESSFALLGSLDPTRLQARAPWACRFFKLLDDVLLHKKFGKSQRDCPTPNFQPMGVILVLLLLLPWTMVWAGERLLVESMEYPWSAIGRLNLDGRSYCTGFLVGESHVLTAAHCFYSRSRKRWFNAREAHFVAGYKQDDYPLHSLVKSYMIADGFSPTVPVSDNDWALAELADPLGRQAGWLGLATTHALGPDAWLLLAGYRTGTAHRLTLDNGCQVRSLNLAQQLLIHDCTIGRGDSGSPLLVFDRGKFQVLGLNVLALGTRQGTTLGGATLVTGLTDTQRWPKAAATVQASHLPAVAGKPAGSLVHPLPDKTMAQLLVLRGFMAETRNSLAKAIRHFERAEHLPETGQVTLELLGRLLRSLKKME